jgi:hypothetical protein
MSSPRRSGTGGPSKALLIADGDGHASSSRRDSDVASTGRRDLDKLRRKLRREGERLLDGARMLEAAGRFACLIGYCHGQIYRGHWAALRLQVAEASNMLALMRDIRGLS